MSTITYEELIKMLAHNYEEIEKSITSQILLNVSNHYPTVGAYRETVWKSLFEMIVPKKYCIEQGVFIIDSYGHKSNEVDLVIFDEMYTPYIFNYGEIKFIPIEAVAAVIQCKSKSIDDKNVTEWRHSVETLITSTDSMARMVNKIVDNSVIAPGSITQTATRPILILCAMVPMKSLSQFKENFDIILSVNTDNKKLHKYIRGEEKSLGYWYDSLNHAWDNMDDDRLESEKNVRREGAVKITKQSEEQRKKFLQELKIIKRDQDGKQEENVLLSLIFQLNQLLMVINNPMLFPHRAYANRFNEILNDSKKGKTDEQQK